MRIRNKRTLAIILSTALAIQSVGVLPVQAEENTKEEVVAIEEEESCGLELTYNSEVDAREEDTVVLSVEAHSTNGEVSYQWWSYDAMELGDDGPGYYGSSAIQNATESSYTIDLDEAKSDIYYCEVTDGFETEVAEFRLNTGLELVEYNLVDAGYGTNVTMKAVASGGRNSLQYQWYACDFEDDGDVYKEIEGMTENSCTVTIDESITKYYCKVTDGVETRYASFDVSINDGFGLSYGNHIEVIYGETLMLEVTATGGTGEFSYEWYDNNGQVIEGATESSCTVPIDENVSEYYYCRVTDGNVTKTADFCIIVDTGLELNYEGTVEVMYGDIARFEVNATGGVGELQYQWYKTIKIEDEWYDEIIEGATENTYMVQVDENVSDYYYYCEVSDGIATKEAWFCLEMNTGLELEHNTEGDNVVEAKYGEEITLEVTAKGGAEELQYQWYKQVKAEDGTDIWEFELIEGATESSYTVSVDENVRKRYSCHVTDGIEMESVCFFLEIDTVLELSYESYIEATYGEIATLEVNATGETGILNYQWYKWYKPNNEENEWVSEIIEGATENTYEVMTDENISGAYFCEVTDGIKALRAYFYLNIDTEIKLTYEEDVEVKYGEPVTLEVTATGGVGELRYQWYKKVETDEGIGFTYEKIEGATETCYAVPGEENVKLSSYYCEVTDGIMSKQAYFGVGIDTGIAIIYKEEVEAKYGETVTMTVTATGGMGELTYKWYKMIKVTEEGWNQGMYRPEEIEGATGNSCTIVVNENASDLYYCEVSDGIATKEAFIRVKIKKSSETPKAIQMKNCDITLLSSSFTYTGNQQKPEVIVKNGTQLLTVGTDYEVEYKNNKNIGTASIIITGKGNYTGSVIKTFKINAKKGSVFTVENYKYKITSASTVAFTGLKSSKITKVIIPKTVKIGGKTFKVTSIANKALYKKTKVTSVTIGSNVQTIGTNAFKNCRKLSSITIKSAKLKNVGKNAFKGIKSTAKIKVLSKKLKAYKKLLKGKGQSRKVKIVKK